nr:PREDICTED: vomeronasal type-1 receptor 1-like [Latimeria chalumnae]|eukprot:XP_014347326.1 PREDICTED: vomeronasal type-1 receptor 1-like [Latimeria chalumnae]
MEVRLIFKAAGSIFLEALGIPGNALILATFVFIGISNRKLLPADILLMKLAFVNLIVMLTFNIPTTVSAFGVRKLFNDDGCKTVIFLFRVGRAMSICITSLLSSYQCIVLAPSFNACIILKQKCPQSLFHITAFLWCLNTIIYAVCVPSMAEQSFAKSNYSIPMAYCVVSFPSYTFFAVLGMVFIVRDLLFIAIMVVSSSCIVFILYKHMKQVKGIRSSAKNHGRTAETQAAKAVVMLVILYVFLFGLDNIIWAYSLNLSVLVPEITDVRHFLASCFPSISPIIIITTNKKLQNKLRFISQRKKLQNAETVVSNVHTISE